MALRVSAELNGQQVDLNAIRNNDAAAESGVPEAPRLLAFADAAVGTDDAPLEAARDDLLQACGPEVLVDTAAIVANFQRMVRIADSTGIPLDVGLGSFSTEVREDLGLNEFGSASNTATLEGWRANAGRFMSLLGRGVIRGVGAVRRATGRAE